MTRGRAPRAAGESLGAQTHGRPIVPFRPSRPALIAFTCATLSSSFAGTAKPNEYLWPADGAPLCVGSENQHRLFGASSSCGALMFSWLHTQAGADSLAPGGVGPVP